MLELPRSPGTSSTLTTTLGPATLPPLILSSYILGSLTSGPIRYLQNCWFQLRDYLFYRRLCVYGGGGAMCMVGVVAAAAGTGGAPAQ